MSEQSGFPIPAEDWALVSEAARAIVNATFAEDEVLQASGFEELCGVLSELRDKYGEHPALLETEADFTDDPARRVALYEQAKQVALTGGWVTYSIRISLARMLLQDLGDAQQAMQELEACRDELTSCADEAERQEWQELFASCSRCGSSPHGNPDRHRDRG